MRWPRIPPQGPRGTTRQQLHVMRGHRKVALTDTTLVGHHLLTAPGAGRLMHCALDMTPRHASGIESGLHGSVRDIQEPDGLAGDFRSNACTVAESQQLRSGDLV